MDTKADVRGKFGDACAQFLGQVAHAIGGLASTPKHTCPLRWTGHTALRRGRPNKHGHVDKDTRPKKMLVSKTVWGRASSSRNGKA